MSTLQYVAIGDIHDDSSLFSRIPEIKQATGVIVTGDITLWGGVQKAQEALLPVERHSTIRFAQIGNMDKPEVATWLEEKHWNNKTSVVMLQPNVYILGLGGSTPTPFNTPSEFSEEYFAQALEESYAYLLSIASDHENIQCIFVSHTPPFDTRCDRLYNGTPVGSKAVRAFIEKKQPTLCLCGHIHESASEDYIGKTHIINPGPLTSGGYITISISQEENTTTIVASRKLIL